MLLQFRRIRRVYRILQAEQIIRYPLKLSIPPGGFDLQLLTSSSVLYQVSLSISIYVRNEYVNRHNAFVYLIRNPCSENDYDVLQVRVSRSLATFTIPSVDLSADRPCEITGFDQPLDITLYLMRCPCHITSVQILSVPLFAGQVSLPGSRLSEGHRIPCQLHIWRNSFLRQQ